MPYSSGNSRARLEQRVRRGLKRAFPSTKEQAQTGGVVQPIVATAKQRPTRTRRTTTPTKEQAQAGGVVPTKERAQAGGVVAPRKMSPEVAAKAAAMRAKSAAGTRAYRAKRRTTKVPLGRYTRKRNKPRVRKGYIPGHPAARRM